MKLFHVAVAATALLTSSAAYAQNAGGTVGGAVGGAAVGAVVGGPVGAAVGGAIGAITGSALPPQPSVVYQDPVVVGETLPDTVTYYPVPEYDAYSYTILNNRRVIVDRHTHRVVRVIE
jgi:phage tail tape-measure protein